MGDLTCGLQWETQPRLWGLQWGERRWGLQCEIRNMALQGERGPTAGDSTCGLHGAQPKLWGLRWETHHGPTKRDSTPTMGPTVGRDDVGL